MDAGEGSFSVGPPSSPRGLCPHFLPHAWEPKDYVLYHKGILANVKIIGKYVKKKAGWEGLGGRDKGSKEPSNS